VRRPLSATCTTRRRLLTGAARLVAGLALAAGCHRAEAPRDVHVRFGVFFGGEVQEREQIPLVVDRARQAIGLRLEFSEPPALAQRVSWELDKPAGKKPGDPARVVAYGEAKTRVGEAVLDVPLAFQPTDRPGSWRVRVALDDKRVLDRPFSVVPASEAASDD
jgi:hypothetical protein